MPRSARVLVRFLADISMIVAAHIARSLTVAAYSNLKIPLLQADRNCSKNKLYVACLPRSSLSVGLLRMFTAAAKRGRAHSAGGRT